MGFGVDDMSPTMVASEPARGLAVRHGGPDTWMCAHPVSVMTGSAVHAEGVGWLV